jgi:DNA-binding transcriptional LysR family regulator
MQAITFDQLRVFLRVAQTGSFSAAARSLHRAQSAVTYAVQKLEEQVGAPLFDRSGYRPVPSEAGRALLPRATRILEEMAAFGSQASAISGGLEPELALVVDSLFPTPALVAALRDFGHEFPAVTLRLGVESLGATAQAVLAGESDLGVALDFAAAMADLHTTPIGEIELVPVAAPGHPLAQKKGLVTAQALGDELQLVLTDRSSLTRGKDFSVFSTRTWRLADLGARHEMLLAGLGWGSMPIHMVEDDLVAGRLKRLNIRRPDGMKSLPRPGVVLARRKDKVLGPAGTWLARRLATALRTPARARAQKTQKRRR